MDIKKFREVIKQREETDDEWEYGVNLCWKREVDILSENIESTIDFLYDECTAEEYSWISEVLDDLLEKCPERKLIECYKSLMYKYPEETEIYHIEDFIRSAEDHLIWRSENGEK